ncbi:MAG TPA: hypothetical protein PKL31_15740 [Fulvivirga sp.]|nr:hypothetical protein [Fulvivirga sp.]
MQQKHVRSATTLKNANHVVNTAVFVFQDQGSWFYYSPALDLTGYGDSEVEAEDSFTLSLSEMVRYTLNKKTMKRLLVSMGWKFTKAKKSKLSLEAPPMHILLQNDEYLQDIFNSKEFVKKNRKVEIPPMALV